MTNVRNTVVDLWYLLPVKRPAMSTVSSIAHFRHWGEHRLAVWGKYAPETREHIKHPISSNDLPPTFTLKGGNMIEQYRVIHTRGFTLHTSLHEEVRGRDPFVGK